VALAPQRDSLHREIAGAPLLPAASALRVRALDATPAWETLMISIMCNATAPAGCASDLERFEH
jgi:hypothetical protein